MQPGKIYSQRWYSRLSEYFFRVAASGLLPAGWFAPPLPGEDERKAVKGQFVLEIVSHCWQYSNMLAYQLSSLVNYPPSKLTVIVTVFYSEEDKDTQELLEFFGSKNIPGIQWNWQTLPKEQLFRRGIGRNKAALSSKADWVWFTDCDIIFHKGCLDSLADALQGRRDALVFPHEERATPMLDEANPMLQQKRPFQVVDIDADKFFTLTRDRAKGEYQIVHGDVARAGGYCSTIPVFQTSSDHWCKCYDDRVYRWLLGTQGVPIDIPGCYQIRHVRKGRYKKDTMWSKLRSNIRHIQAWIREPSTK